jgi:RimJ/RimL family protein N-acetyltransferase
MTIRSVDYRTSPSSMAVRVIETARLILRPITTRDVEMLHQIWIEPEVREYLWDGEIITTDRVRSLIDTSLQSFKEKGFGLWAILAASDGFSNRVLRVLVISRSS